MSILTIERRPPLRVVRLDTGKRNILDLGAVEALADALSPDPEEAVSVGFLDALAAGGDMEATAIDRAHEVAELSDSAYQGSLRAVWGAAIQEIEAVVEAQLRRRDAACSTSNS